MSTIEITKIINAVADQAEYFLKDSGEFYPFGWVIGIDNSSTPVNVFQESEFPSSEKIINDLIEVFKIKLSTNKCKAIAICINVNYTPPNEPTIDALEVRIDSIDNCINYFLTYRKTGNNIEFGEVYGEMGTLNLFEH